MNFLAVLLLSLFISVKSSNDTQDGTFHKNTETNGENLYLLLSPKGSVVRANITNLN